MGKKVLAFLLLFCLSLGVTIAQISKVTGVVISEEDDLPIVGASILVKGTTVGALTDLDGKFVLTNIPANSKTIVVSYVGMETQELEIRPDMKIFMKGDTQMLDEVVVTVAYGTAKKSSLTGAISSVNKEQIEMRPVSSVTSALEGTTSGVQINSTYGQPGEGPSIRIRGIGTVNGSSDPLYVIDGMPFGGNISDLNPNDIESISVLKDAASCALYGNRASNGVILITTKRGTSDKMSFELKINQGSYTRGIKEYSRTNPYQFMEASWQNMKNVRMSAGDDAATAAAYATNNLISESLYLNIFNKPDTELFDATGHMVSDAKSCRAMQMTLTGMMPLSVTDIVRNIP
ncbi:TonB-dependent receptor plug domain-containing protein [Bacteroides ilei]|uniref:TonB-dependent receptor plug domain-containing protein n=1 Tax=Bacteroides ilei TaxID=1907658 RepID=UPI000AB86490|nr:TonB-dependent receptor plug domain-containing protein [Bacteroides ilei]